MVIAGRFPKPPHPDISERLARNESAKISPHPSHRRPAVRATLYRRAISIQAVRFLLAVVAEPAGVEAAVFTALTQPVHAPWFASGLCFRRFVIPALSRAISGFGFSA
jgi:hypothetical protein